jgi:hypothetical protein
MLLEPDCPQVREGVPIGESAFEVGMDLTGPKASNSAFGGVQRSEILRKLPQ